MAVNLALVPTGIPVDANGKGVQTSYNNMQSGNSSVTTANTAVALASSFTQAKKIDVYNASSSTIYVGDSTVSASPANGIPIYPAQVYGLAVTNLALVYVNCATANSAFSWNVFW